MNRIILDEFRRRWWVWCFICFACLGLGFISAIVSAMSKNSVYIALYLALFTANLVPRELGFGRVLLSLPLAARQIGQTFWIISVAIPSVLLALFGGLGIYIHNSSTTAYAYLEIWCRFVVLGSLGFGSTFWLFSGAPTNPREKRGNRFTEQLYSYGFSIALFGGGYLLYKSTISHEIKFVIVCMFGLVFSVLGWFRAEGLIIDHGAYRREIASLYRPKATFRPQAGYGGVPYLVINSCTRVLSILMLTLAFTVGMTIWKNRRFNGSEILEFMQTLRLLLFPLCLWAVLPVGVHQKFLRSLPLTSKKLSAVILCLPTLPFLIVCGIFIPIDIYKIGAPAAMSLLKGELLFLAPLCVFVTAIVWRDESRFEKIVKVLIVFILSAIPATIQLVSVTWNPGKQDLPVWVIVAVPLLAYSLALLAISRLLERNEMTYRVQGQPLANVNSPNW